MTQVVAKGVLGSHIAGAMSLFGEELRTAVLRTVTAPGVTF